LCNPRASATRIAETTFSPFTFNQLDRHTTLQALEQTLNKIFLLNSGAKVTTDYSNKEENIGMVAEE